MNREKTLVNHETFVISTGSATWQLMEEDTSSHVAASTPMDTPEQDGADATKPAVDESSGKGDDEEKPKTLLQALGDQSNRNLVKSSTTF